MPDAERAKKTLQRRFFFSPIQRIHKLGGEFYTHPLIMQELVNPERKEIGRGFDPSRSDKQFDPALAEPFDIESGLGHEMRQRLPDHGGTGNIHAPPSHFPFQTGRGLAAGRAYMGENERLRIRGTFRKYGPHHFGDDIPGALDHHTIADSDVPIADFILIVEGCPADKHTADVHRLQFGHRGQDPRPPHLNGNIQQQSRRLLRRKLPRNGEPRSPRRIAQRLLCLKVIELHDHAVDLVRQRLPFFTQRGIIGFHFFGTQAEAASGRRLEPKVTEPPHDLLIRTPRLHPTEPDIPKPIRQKPQRTGRGNRGIQLAYGAGRRIARIGKCLEIFLPQPLIKQGEIPSAENDFPPHFQTLRGIAVQHFGQVAHRLHGLRHEFADFAVSARQGFDKPPVLIHKLKGEAVHFRITPKSMLKPFLGVVQTLEKALPLLRIEHVVQAVHPPRMGLGFQRRQHLSADPVRRRIGRSPFGMPLFQPQKLLKGGIVFVVGDFRRIQRMIPMVMVNHKRTELFQTFFIGILDQKGLQRPLIHDVILRCPAAEAKQSKTVPEAA